MALFRVLKRLSRNDQIIEVGEVTDLGWLREEQQQILVDVKAVSLLEAPPLQELPGWKRRAARFRKIGIIKADEFLEGEPEELSQELRIKETTIRRWQQEVRGWLVLPPPSGG